MNNDKEIRDHIAKITREQNPESNLIVAKTLLAFAAVCFAMLIVFKLGIIKSKGLFVDIALVASPALFIISSVWCILRKGKGIAFQYIFLVLLAVFWLDLELMSGYKCKMLLPVLIVLSLRYYNRKFTTFTYVVCVFAMLASVFCNAYLYDVTGFIDLNLVSFDESFDALFHISYDDSLNGFIHKSIISLRPSSEMLLTNGLLITFLPNMIFLTFTAWLTARFMRYNLVNILKAEELASREANQRLELSDLKTKNMLSQVKPHFVYNTLCSVAQLCTEDPKRAKSLTIDFADYLRNHLDTLNEETLTVSSFSAELAHIRSYLNIELVRFEGTLRVEYDIQAEDFNLPELCIQPIVENAVKHGVCKKEDGGTVKIAARKEESGWRIVISDDGVGFDPQKIHDDGKTHIGIENVRKRLALFGGMFMIDSTPGAGTTATVFIPEKEGMQ